MAWSRKGTASPTGGVWGDLFVMCGDQFDARFRFFKGKGMTMEQLRDHLADEMQLQLETLRRDLSKA